MNNLFHYVACGLSNVWLENGYEVQDSPKGQTFKIYKLEELHEAIGLTLTEKDEPLTGDEIRFLRTELSMSRKALGDYLDNSPETIKKWESGENKIIKTADLVLRALYREYHNENSGIKALVDVLNHLEKVACTKSDLKFKWEAAGDWVRDCA